MNYYKCNSLKMYGFKMQMKNYVNMKTKINEKYKNRDKLIQSRRPEQYTKNQDCPGKSGKLECWNATTNMTGTS